ncbi:MAG: nucleotide sugar dehydrogenase [Archaeoglobaceae archaeon]
MKVSIVGSGYVGIVTGIGFADLGNEVVFVDVDEHKIDTINSGEPPIYEKRLKELMEKTRNNYYATSDFKKAIEETDATFICVGTPSREDGSMDLVYLKSASEQIGEALRDKQGFHVVVVKSTVVPGTSEEVVKPILEQKSGKKAFDEFGLAMNPEFLREGNAVYDFFNPDRLVLGVGDERTEGVLQQLYADFNCDKLITDIKTAEMIKYVSNSFLAAKISFANEVGNICKKLGIDTYEVFKGVGMDHRINPSFFRAGLGYGGSCLEGDEKILVKNSEGLELLSFEEFYKNYANGTKLIDDVSVLSFNKENNSFEFKNITRGFKREYKGEVLEIKTSMGCKIKVTEDHPMIVQEDGGLRVKKSGGLGIGDRIPLFQGTPEQESPRNYFDLIDILKKSSKFDLSKVYLRPYFNLEVLKERLRYSLSEYNSKYSYDRLHDFFRGNYLPLDVFLEVEDELSLERSDFKIYTSKGSTTYVPAIIEAGSDFWRFVGYYISEGHINKDNSGQGGVRDRIMISFNYRGEEDYVEEVESYLQRLGIKYDKSLKETSTQITFSSRVFAYFISEYLGCGTDSYTAAIPNLAYQESISNKKSLLSGLFRGDGYIAYPKHSRAVVLDYGSISKDLIQGMRFLLQSIGVIPSYKTSKSRKSTGPAHFLRVSGKSQVEELKSIFRKKDEEKISRRLESYKKEIKPTGHKRLKNYSTVKVRNIERSFKETDVYSLEVEGNHNFVTTDGLLVHNCFPKDVKALVYRARELGEDPEIMNSVINVNEKQPVKLIELLKKHVPELKGRRVGVLGLAFKPDTDDIRESRAIPVVQTLLDEGANVVAYDPKAMEEFSKLFPEVEYSTMEGVLSCDAVLIVTEWDEFEGLDYTGRIVIDGRKVEKARQEARIYEGVCW